MYLKGLHMGRETRTLGSDILKLILALKQLHPRPSQVRRISCTHTSFRHGLAGNAPKHTEVSRRASAPIYCDGDGRMLNYELGRPDSLAEPHSYMSTDALFETLK